MSHYVDRYADRMAAAASAHEAAFGKAGSPRDGDEVDQVASVVEGEGAPAKAKGTETQSEPNVAQLVERRLLDGGVHEWHDVQMAVGLMDLTGCVDADGEVVPRAVDAAAIRLVREKPWLVREPRVPDLLPLGPSALPVGSGRRRFGLQGLDAETLRKKYPAL